MAKKSWSESFDRHKRRSQSDFRLFSDDILATEVREPKYTVIAISELSLASSSSKTTCYFVTFAESDDGLKR